VHLKPSLVKQIGNSYFLLAHQSLNDAWAKQTYILLMVKNIGGILSRFDKKSRLFSGLFNASRGAVY
jgi:hypothetical protein